MANKKTKSATRKSVKKQMMKRPVQLSDSAERLRNHIGMVMDPCNAILGPTAYRGADGFVTRFKINQTAGTTTTNQYFVSVFYPAYNATFLSGYAAATNVVTPAYINGPGQAFLLANADSQRVVGACTKITYLGSELNRQGVVYRGVMPEAAITGATVQDIITLCQRTDRTPDSVLETKFIPSSIEETYWKTGGVAPSENGDRNVIVTVLYGGAVTAVDTFLEHTLICEWRPKFGVGLVCPPPNTPDVTGGLEKVRTAISRFGHWWLEGTHTAGTAVRTAAHMYQGTRALANVARLALTAA